MNKMPFTRPILIIILFCGFGYAVWLLLDTAPQSRQKRPAPPTPLVEVIDSQVKAHSVSLEAQGTVIAAKTLNVSAQVSGKLLSLHSEFEPGGLIKAGETLFNIDPTDYELALASARASVTKAQADIRLEQGRRHVAKEELKLLKGNIKLDQQASALALRKPQLAQVQAALATAQQQLEKAKLDLSRTSFALPYDVVVLERNKVAQEIIGERETIGVVAPANNYWLELKLPPRQLPYVAKNSAAEIRYQGHSYTGKVVRIRPNLSEASRLAGVIIEIDDPLSIQKQERPALLMGSYVSAEVEIEKIKQGISAPRRAVRNNQRLLVVDSNQQLQVRPAEVLWESGHKVILAPTLKEKDQLVISRSRGLIPGTTVRSQLVETN